MKSGIDFLIEHGDAEVKFNLLTEKQDNYLEEQYKDFSTYNGNFEIQIDVLSKKELMSKMK